MGAGLAQPRTAENDFTDAKLLVDKMIERNAPRQNIAPRLARV